jgi:dCMP deaminase
MSNSEKDYIMLQKSKEAKNDSHDPDRQVGAVIVGVSGQVIATGSNAPPTLLGFDLRKSHAAIKKDPEWKYFMLEHAERNAIFAAINNQKSLQGAVMYCTLFPCSDCARAISNSGIVRVVVLKSEFPTSRDEKWLKHYGYANEIFKLSGILVDLIEPENGS